MENIENNIDTILENPPKEEQLVEPEYEKISCQYCQDAGTCTFCERGKAELPKTKRLSRRKKGKWYLK